MSDSWESYFMVLRSILDHSPYGRDTRRYSSLLWQLHNTEFKVMLRMDENRIADALEFRKTYFYNRLDHPVCILEMMVSLAGRLERDIMQGTVEGDRTVDWFWVMINSLGLSNMTDDAYNEDVVASVLRRFMRRRYSPDGRGGLFTISNVSVDMREQDIWYQAALYLTEILRVEGFIEP